MTDKVKENDSYWHMPPPIIKAPLGAQHGKSGVYYAGKQHFWLDIWSIQLNNDFLAAFELSLFLFHACSHSHTFRSSITLQKATGWILKIATVHSIFPKTSVLGVLPIHHKILVPAVEVGLVQLLALLPVVVMMIKATTTMYMMC